MDIRLRTHRPGKATDEETARLRALFTECDEKGLLERFQPELFYLALRYKEQHTASMQWKPARFGPRADYTLREQIWHNFNSPAFGTVAKIINVATVVLVVASQVVFLLESFPRYSVTVFPDYANFWLMIEVMFTVIFSAEYIIRLVTAPNPFRFIIYPLNIFDLLSILPFFLELLYDTGSDVRAIRAIRLARVFRLLKLLRTLTTLTHIIKTTIQLSVRPLLGPVLIFAIGNLIIASFLWFIEIGEYKEIPMEYLAPDALCEQRPSYLLGVAGCPHAPSEFLSIPDTLYWFYITSLTIGDQHEVPVTRFGKIIVSLTLIMGIVAFAVPLTVFGYNFSMVMDVYFRAKDNTVKLKLESELTQQDTLQGTYNLNLLLIEKQLEELLYEWKDTLPSLSAMNPKLCRHVKYFLQMTTHYLLTSSQQEMKQNIEDYNKMVLVHGVKEIDLIAHVFSSSARGMATPSMFSAASSTSQIDGEFISRYSPSRFDIFDSDDDGLIVPSVPTPLTVTLPSKKRDPETPIHKGPSLVKETFAGIQLVETKGYSSAESHESSPASFPSPLS